MWGECALGALVTGSADNRRAGSCTGSRATPSSGDEAGAGCVLSYDEDMYVAGARKGAGTTSWFYRSRSTATTSEDDRVLLERQGVA